MKDLRSFLAEVEREEGPIREIQREVSPDRELAAIVRLLEDRGNPIAYFHDVSGESLPVVSRRPREPPPDRARAGNLGDGCGRRVPRAAQAGGSSASASDGPVKEVRHLGDDVDLARLPIPTHAEKDGGPFLTSAVGIARGW